MKKKKITKKILKKREKRALKREYKLKLNNWKKEVKLRDNYCCQMCEKDLKDTPASQHPHHIIPNLPQYKELSTDIENGILLCPYCHKWSRESPHLNALYFNYWLSIKKPLQYNYLVNKLFNTQKEPLEASKTTYLG